MNKDISGFFEMLTNGYCGYIKKTERVMIKEIDDSDLTTVVCSGKNEDRVDLVPFKDLRQIDLTLLV